VPVLNLDLVLPRSQRKKTQRRVFGNLLSPSSDWNPDSAATNDELDGQRAADCEGHESIGFDSDIGAGVVGRCDVGEDRTPICRPYWPRLPSLSSSQGLRLLYCELGEVGESCLERVVVR
jgi:hypothetical protein